MKFLKSTVISVYIILILLLLLSFMRCERCSSPKTSQETPQEKIDDIEEVAENDTIPPTSENEEIEERAESVGQRGQFKVTLLWDFKADIDLHIIEPNNFHIYFAQKVDSETGGTLDVDNRTGGKGAAENIFWENPPKGEYDISVKYYAKHGNIVETGPCTVVIFKGDEVSSYTIDMNYVGQHTDVAKIIIP